MTPTILVVEDEPAIQELLAVNLKHNGFLVVRAANAGKHVIMVDQFANFPNSELEDGVHPNSTGYARMAGVWYAAISSYLH